MKRWLLLSCVLYAGALHAQTVEPGVLRTLQQAQAAQAAGEPGKASRLLDELTFDQGSYAELLVLRNKGYLAWQQDQLPQAIRYLQQAEKHSQISAEDRQADRLSLARLTLAAGQPQQTVAYLKGLPQTDETLQLGIQAWYQQKRYDQALPLAEQYLARQSKVDRPWTELMVSLYYGSKNHSKAADWQRRLLALEPNSLEQWQRLVNLQRLAGNEAAAFATLRTAYNKGLLQDSQQLQQLLAQASVAGQPWQGARLLQQWLKQGKLVDSPHWREQLAQLHWQARDYQAAMQQYRQLAEQGGKASHWLMVAQLALQNGRWQEAEQALDAAERSGAARQRISNWRDWLETSREAEQPRQPRQPG